MIVSKQLAKNIKIDWTGS